MSFFNPWRVASVINLKVALGRKRVRDLYQALAKPFLSAIYRISVFIKYNN